MKSLQTFGVTLLLGLLASGCQKKDAEPVAAATNPPPITGSTNVQFYLVRGEVKKVDVEGKTATIKHEEIPKFMPAMTMPFKAKEAKELEGLAPGDVIWFRLWISPDESWIDKVRKEPKVETNSPQASAPPEREAVRVVRDVEPLKIGDPMPDYTFTNELGKTIHLSEFKGQALAFTFIFTRCPLPEFCPRMTGNFAEVSKKLSAMPDAPANWHLLSISFDPHFDTPEVLRSYAQAFQYDPTRWNFATGAMSDIDAITDQLNLTIVKRGNEWDHKVRTVVVDANGRVQQIIYGNEWKPDALVQEIVKAASPPANSQPAAADPK
jgi:protein SCO1